MTDLDLANVQGFVVRGYRLPMAGYLFLRIDDPSGARTWLADIAPDVLTATPWSAGHDDISDPRVIYDTASGRWFAVITDVTRGSFVIAVSAGPDPLQGPWRMTQFTGRNAACLDQPILGVDDVGVFVTTVLFSGSCDSPDATEVGAGILVLNKADLLGAPSVSYQAFGPDRLYSSYAPPQSMTSSTTEFFAAIARNKAYGVHVAPYIGAPPSGHFGNAYDVGTSPIADPPPIWQSGTSHQLDRQMDNRVLDASWQAGKLYVVANDSCVPSGDRYRQSCVRILTVDTTTGALADDAEIGFNNEDDFYGALRPDVNGTLDIVNGFITNQQYPGLAATTHIPGGGFSNTQTIVDGTAPSTSGRYGDYFGAAVDPADPRVVWVAGEYGSGAGGTTNGWSTEIAAISADPVFASPAPTPRLPTMTTTAARRDVRQALSHRFGSVFRRGSGYSASCSRKSRTEMQCRVSWRYRKHNYSGTVVVFYVLDKGRTYWDDHIRVRRANRR